MQKRTRPCPLVCAVPLSLDSQGKLLQWFSFLEDLTKSYVSETFFSISFLICFTPDESLVRAALMLLIVILLNAEVVL